MEINNVPKHHICVCICTYQRPEMLRLLLSKLEDQETKNLFHYSIIIVDNDRFESARLTAKSFAQQSKIPVGYYVEQEQNIALARNKTIENAKGDLIGFIDDDEFPTGNWLLNLYEAIERYKVDGVLGPVLPCFETTPPKWVLKGHLFDRPTYLTGHVLGWESTRTGNALLRIDMFKEDRICFDPIFGSGGEDRDFFRRKIAAGYIFVWCNEAPVYETVPRVRWARTVLLKRALLRGEMSLNRTRSRTLSVLYSVIAITVYTICLPLLSLLGHHVFMKYLIKDFDHLGKVLAFLRIDLVKEKYVTGEYTKRNKKRDDEL